LKSLDLCFFAFDRKEVPLERNRYGTYLFVHYLHTVDRYVGLGLASFRTARESSDYLNALIGAMFDTVIELFLLCVVFASY